MQWVEDSIADGKNIELLASKERTEIAQSYAQNAFLQGQNIDAKNSDYINIYIATANQQYCNLFDGLRIDTCTKRTSVISTDQNRAYCRTFNLPQPITPSNNRTTTGNSGRRTSIEEVTIQLPFKRLPVVIEVAFLVLEDSIQTLLSVKHNLDNGLDLSIQ